MNVIQDETVSIGASSTTLLKATEEVQWSATVKEWFFTNLGSGTLTCKPYFDNAGTNVTTHTAYTVPANQTVAIDIASVSEWLLSETAGNAIVVKIAAYDGNH